MNQRDRQTQGKTFPYLFSQCQPIYARSLLPVQGVNFTYAGEQMLNILDIRQSFSQNCEEHLTRPYMFLAVLTTLQTYSAQVASILPALLSAFRVSPPSGGPPHDGKIIGKDLVTYIYDQPVAIPSYLIAIAAGDLRYRSFTKPEGKTWTSGIWTEPSLMDAAFWEFSEDTTRQVTRTRQKVR